MSFRTIARKSFAILTAAFVFLALAGSLQSQETPKVVEIAVTGNQNISDDAIRAVIASLKLGADFTAGAMETDRKAIEALGYFSAVTARSETTDAGVKVIFDVVENPVIKEIRILGNKSVSTERIMSLLRSKVGQVFNEQTLTQDIEAIQKEYVEQGYYAYVSEDVGVDPQTGVLTIPVSEQVVASIDIVGNKKTPDYVFLREMKTKPGKVLNRKTLEEDVRKIYSLNILDVTAYQRPQVEPTESGQVAVLIPVTEMKTGQISLGLGYSSKQKLVGRIELSESNFRGRGEHVNLLTEIGQRSDIISSGRNSYQLSFYEPWVDDRHTSLNASVFDKLVYRFSSSISSGSNISSSDRIYSERRKGGSLGLSRPLTDAIRLSTSVRMEDVAINLPGSLPPTDFLSRISQPGPIRSVSFTGAQNTRDFDADPSHGWYNSLTLEVGHAEKNVFSGTDPDANPNSANTIWVTNQVSSGIFEKAQFDFRKYISKGGPKTTPDEKRKTIALRMTGGITSGTVLFSEQFFVGGAETLRGYREDRFWGDRMILLNAEYRMPMGKTLTGVAFADYGDAWQQADNITITDKRFFQHTDFKPNLGVGAGIRVITPIGPLRLDYGRGNEGARTHFSIGHAF